jgi:hypothetical protein
MVEAGEVSRTQPEMTFILNYIILYSILIRLRMASQAQTKDRFPAIYIPKNTSNII